MRFPAALLALTVPALAAPDMKVELGRRLFMDPTVSLTGTVSCSSCHQPEHGFSDPRARSEDENGRSTRRHSQPILDLGGARHFHWDGEFASLAELIEARLAPAWRAQAIAGVARVRRFEEARAAGRSPDEERFRAALGGLIAYGGHRRAESESLVRRLGDDGRYDLGFRAAFGTPEVTYDRISLALGTYVLSLRSGTSRFDRAALSDAQLRGFELFKGKAGCAACHLAEGKRAHFTDGLFHDTGIASRARGMGDCGLGDCLELGAGAITFVAEDLRKFKTPSLRDVSRRPPYMHDGSLRTLEDVVRHYDGGGFGGRRLGLSEDEIASLVAFLQSLESDERPGLGRAWAKRRHARLRIVDLLGKPLEGLEVEIRPAGDRLFEVPEPLPRPLTGAQALTDASGYISFEYPAWTHVHLVAHSHEIHYGRLLPDFVTSMELIAAPKEKAALKLRMRGDDAPDELEVLPSGVPEKVIVRLRLVRKLADGSAIYAGDRYSARRWGVRRDLRAAGPDASIIAADRVIDLNGGWAEPIDLRPDPGERGGTLVD